MNRSTRTHNIFITFFTSFFLIIHMGAAPVDDLKKSVHMLTWLLDIAPAKTGQIGRKYFLTNNKYAFSIKPKNGGIIFVESKPVVCGGDHIKLVPTRTIKVSSFDEIFDIVMREISTLIQTPEGIHALCAGETKFLEKLYKASNHLNNPTLTSEIEKIQQEFDALTLTQ